jgi:L-fuculose-phosphate aldolase
MLETCCDVLLEAYKRNWITSRDGNVSIRHRDRDHFYITPSGVRKQTLQPDQFKKIKIVDQLNAVPPFISKTWKEEYYTDISSNLKPSGELSMHFGLQKYIKTEIRVVLHLHPTYTVATMYRQLDLQSLMIEFPELSRYTSVGPSVPLIPPITKELADACVNNIGYNSIDGSIRYNIIGMDRHGVVAVDETPWRAFEHIERLEHICQIVLASKTY